MTPEQGTAILVALAAVVTALTGLTAAVLRLYLAVKSNREALDGKIDQLVQTSRVAGHAEGVLLGQQLANPPEDAEQT